MLGVDKYQEKTIEVSKQTCAFCVYERTVMLFMSLPSLSSFSSRFVFGLKPAQLLSRLKILSSK